MPYIPIYLTYIHTPDAIYSEQHPPRPSDRALLGHHEEEDRRVRI